MKNKRLKTPGGKTATTPARLKRVIRLDSQPLNQTYFTPEGYLVDRPIMTSTGIFEYTNADGSVRRELRLPEDVFDPESLHSYRGKPIIVTHDAGLITKDNVAEEQIGTILSDGYRSGDDVRAEIIIHDSDEMKQSGLRELSLGYNLDLDETPGVWEGEPYDAIQRNIRINHLALVREARAGEQARLNIDSRDSALKGGKKLMKKKTNKRRVTRKDSVLPPDELKKAIEEYKARREARMAAKADDDDEETAVPSIPAKASAGNPAAEDCGDDEKVAVADGDDSDVEEQVQLVKDRRDRRDEEGDPENLEEANGVIANQDEDIDILFDIIDTLLAQIAFDDDEETEKDPLAEDDDDEDAPLVEDDDEEEKDPLAEDDDEEEDPFAEDDDEEETPDNEDDDDDDIPNTDPSDLSPIAKLNADGIDRIVRERVQIGKVATLLNMDGLEAMKPMKAKKLIIKTVKPGIRLDGKSTAYINAMFDLSCQEVTKRSRKDTMYQRKQMFNKDSRSSRRSKANTTDAARARMIKRMQNAK